MTNKILLLNLPNAEQITRRYMCSYVSPESLMPPLELISCGAVCKEWLGFEVKLIDAIAEQLSLEATQAKIDDFHPNYVLSLVGFECYQEDVDTLKKLKTKNPECTFILFGYYPTQFPKETLLNTTADFVLLGEPEMVLNSLLTTLTIHTSIADLKGIAYLGDNNELIQQGESGRIRDPNELPMPAYHLLPANKYYEPLFAKPYGMIQTMRGCPYQCNYCVKSYGTKLSQLSPDRIIEEIKELINLYGVKSIRFIDDTFTINKRRTIELCEKICAHKLIFEWACLSRTDNLDLEMLTWMKKAGCKRIYFGIESGSQRMLDIYKKNINREEALQALHLCRRAGIETAGFFMAGHPEETEEDHNETIRFATSANLTYASYNPLKPYPGTAVYNELAEQIDFSIYPYVNKWKNTIVDQNYDRRKQEFYRKFYLRIGYLWGNFFALVSDFDKVLLLSTKLLRYLWWDKQFIIGGRKAPLDNVK